LNYSFFSFSFLFLCGGHVPQGPHPFPFFFFIPVFTSSSFPRDQVFLRPGRLARSFLFISRFSLLGGRGRPFSTTATPFSFVLSPSASVQSDTLYTSSIHHAAGFSTRGPPSSPPLVSPETVRLCSIPLWSQGLFPPRALRNYGFFDRIFAGLFSPFLSLRGEKFSIGLLFFLRFRSYALLFFWKEGYFILMRSFQSNGRGGILLSDYEPPPRNLIHVPFPPVNFPQWEPPRNLQRPAFLTMRLWKERFFL